MREVFKIAINETENARTLEARNMNFYTIFYFNFLSLLKVNQNGVAIT